MSVSKNNRAAAARRWSTPRFSFLFVLVTGLALLFGYHREHDEAVDDALVSEQPARHVPVATAHSGTSRPGEAGRMDDSVTESPTSPERLGDNMAHVPAFDPETYRSPREYALAVQVHQMFAELDNPASERDARIALSKLRMLLRDTSLSEQLREQILIILTETAGDPNRRIAALSTSILKEETTSAELPTAQPEPSEAEASYRKARRVEALRQTLVYHPNAGQRRRALDELSLSRDPAALDALATALQDTDARNRYAAVQKLGALPVTADGQVRLLLQQALNDLDERVASLAQAELVSLEARQADGR